LVGGREGVVGAGGLVEELERARGDVREVVRRFGGRVGR
jgi:hypothetical protein